MKAIATINNVRPARTIQKTAIGAPLLEEMHSNCNDVFFPLFAAGTSGQQSIAWLNE
jgi:hypothetical protein